MGQKGSREAHEAPRAQDREEGPQEDTSPAPAPAPLADFTQDSSDDEPPAAPVQQEAEPAAPGGSTSTRQTLRFVSRMNPRALLPVTKRSDLSIRTEITR